MEGQNQRSRGPRFLKNGLQWISLGKRAYAPTLEYQEQLRRQRREAQIPDTLLTVEHDPIITQGRRPAEDDLRVEKQELRLQGLDFAQVNRGGKLTYHGPGQLVAYFIVSLQERRWSIPDFVHRVEETALQTLENLGVQAERRKGFPGLWIQEKKIVSVGLSVDHGVSMHGLALNIDPSLKHFNLIVPCGLAQCEMTSIAAELGQAPKWSEVETLWVGCAEQILI